MTNEQKERISKMRTEGKGYTAIAKAVGLSKETVKSWCKRNDMGGQLVWQAARNAGKICPQCGGKIEQNLSAKPKRFWSAVCRQAWWNAHPEQVGRKAVYEFKCANCGKNFTAYGNSGRKYCCHNCYISARFKTGGNG